MSLKETLSNWLTKLNPAQAQIVREYSDNVHSSEIHINYINAYDSLEVVRNGVDRLVNACASFDVNVQDTIQGVTPSVNGVRKKKLHTLLNYQPNPFQDASRFRRAIFLDLIIDGNAFIYFDGAYLYHLPAAQVTIKTDPKTFVSGYEYSGVKFQPLEVLHIMGNSVDNIYRGSSKLGAAKGSIKSLMQMQDYQVRFFDNGGVPGLVLETDAVLGDKNKDKLIASWTQRFNPKNGGRRPLILDGGLKLKALAQTAFQELDFPVSIKDKEEKILMALGIPSIIINGGNNANISPNLRLFYLETVLPMVKMYTAALENFFGYDLEPEAAKVSALQPDMQESAAYYTTLVNGGVISPNEAREELRYQSVGGHDDLRVPANIAGSAANPSTGGRPPTPKKEI